MCVINVVDRQETFLISTLQLPIIMVKAESVSYQNGQMIILSRIYLIIVEIKVVNSTTDVWTVIDVDLFHLCGITCSYLL